MGEFAVGDKAVYPAHGVGVIQAIERRNVAGTVNVFYTLRIIENGMTVMVPKNNAERYGMRAVMSVIDQSKVYEILRERDIEIDNQTWNRRYREYMSKIKTGSPFEVAKVLRDLAILKGDKQLSFGERKMFDNARTLLVKELAVAKDLPEALIEKEIDEIFKIGSETT